jgi:glycosyltransferase involved in cell wall biosynthesis
LNFGRNISDIISESGSEYNIIYSKQQPNKDVALKELEELNAKLHECPLPQYLTASTLVKLPWSLYRFYRILLIIKPDVIHTRATLVGFIGRIAGKLAGVNNIYHHQDDFLHREKKLGLFQKWLFRNIDVLLSRITTKIFFVSDTILKEAVLAGVKKDKCIMVGHDLHPNFVNNANKTFENRHPIIEKVVNGNSHVLIGTIARIEDFKGIDTILDVAEYFKDSETSVQFLIRGNGSRLRKYQERISKMGLRNIVHLISDYLPANEIPWLFSSFDVFFLPTRREGFGMVFAEAMCMGVPVVAPKMYPVVEVVPDELGFLVEPESVTGYVGALRELIHNDEKRKSLGTKSREYALERWGKRSSAERVVKEMLSQ